MAGPSMVPALRSGDLLLVRWGGQRWRPGDVAVVALPDRPLSVKRVRRIDPAGYWVEGDNPFGSTDSRQLGVLPAVAIRGRVIGRLWPKPGRVPPAGQASLSGES